MANGINCGIQFPQTEIFKKIDSILGDDTIKSISFKLEVWDGKNSFNAAFIKWFKKKYNTESEPNFNANTTEAINTIASAIRSYYYSKHADIHETINNDIIDTNTAALNYTNTLERENGKIHIADIILDEFNRLNNAGIELENNQINHYLDVAKEKWLDVIFDYIIKNPNNNYNLLKDIKKDYENAKVKYEFLDKLLGENKDATAINLLAVYGELFDTNEKGTPTVKAVNYLTEVLYNPKISDVLHEIRRDLDDDNLLKALQAEETANDDINSTTQLDDLDISILEANNHIGVYTSFMTHVGPRIRNYFNSLKKLQSPTIDDYDTSNTYGIPDRMDANQCSSMIYNNADVSNMGNFIDSIRHIGETIRGFEAFVQLANDLKENKDFATELLTVFQKVIFDRLNVVENDGVISVRISNQEALPRNVIVFDMLNDIRGNVEDFTYDANIRNIKSLIGDIKIQRTKELTDEKIAKVNQFKIYLTNFIRNYFPSLQELAISSYIEYNNNANWDIDKQLENIYFLATIAERLANNSKKVYANYNKMKQDAAAIDEENKNNDRKRANGEWVDLSEYKSASEIWARRFTTPINKEVQEFANLLLPYSNISTSLNSRNIYGNNNSSVINVSWIGRIQQMLNMNIVQPDGTIRNPTLERWGAEILSIPQFRTNTVLLEQRDEAGNLLTPGIFYYEGNSLRVTNYANDIIKCQLFDGTAFIDQGNNASYADMTSSSFLPTSYLAYHKTDSLESNGNFNGNVGTFFLGTPSDAPKIFTARLPKVDTRDLITTSDEEKQRVNNDVQTIIKNLIPVLGPSGIMQYIDQDKIGSVESLYNRLAKANKIPDSQLYEYLEPSHNLLLSNDELVKEYEEGKAYGTFITTSGIVITLEGDLVKAGKGVALANAKLKGIFNSKIIKDDNVGVPELYPNGIPDEINTYYTNKYRKLLSRQDVEVNGVTYKKQQERINTDSIAYKLLRKHFKQEMIDAAVALNHYFNLVPLKDENDKIIPGKFVVELNYSNDKFGEPVFKEGVDKTKGYKFYHLDENGEVLRNKDGVYSLNGKVFGSNKFTLVLEEQDKKGNTINVPRNYLDEVIDRSNNPSEDSINLLYGGGMAILCDTDEIGNLVVRDVEFNKAQEENIEKHLIEFIRDYREQAIKEIEAKEELIHGVSTDNAAITDYAINQLLAFYNFDDLFIGSSKFYKDVQTILKRTKEYQGSGVPYGISDITEFGQFSLDDISPEISFLNGGVITQPQTETYVDASGKVNTRIKKDEKGKTLTEEVSIQDLFKGTILDGVKQRKGFRAVTIKNSIRTNNTAIKELYNKLTKELGVPEKRAKDILYGKVKLDKDGNPKKNKAGDDYEREGGFTDTKVNDAQSYITVQEWVRRIFARGQGQRYLPLIRKLIDPNYKLTNRDVEQFIQVQKNFYFDIHKDDEYGIYNPRQIKNAEFVLVPQLIEGTQLEEVYQLMQDGHIDQLNTVETSKAANEKVLTLWDDDGNISEERLENFAKEADDNAEIYSYNYLYTQQETPQHMNAENKAGIQILKKTVDNIPDDLPKGHPLYGLKDEFFGLFNENIEESFTRVLKQVKVPLNPDGTIKLNENGDIDFKSLDDKRNFFKNFYAKLKEELLRTGLDNNSAKFVDIKEDSTVPDMPSYINNYITKFESLVQSIFNNGITRQKLPGFHAPQITNIGWKSMNDDLIKLREQNLKKTPAYKRFEKWAAEKSKTIEFKNNYLAEDSIKLFKEFTAETLPNQTFAKELKYHLKEDDKGNIVYTGEIQVILPYSYLGIDKTSAHYKKMSDEDILKELETKGLDKIIGYRIPTEGKQSVCNMKVVGFIDDSYGSTIIVPDDWVSQTGSDFDVDSVYGIQFETYTTKTGELKKIEYKNDTSYSSYFDYISKDDDDIKKLLENLLSNSSDDLIKSLPTVIQNGIKGLERDISKEISDNNLNETDGKIYRAKELYKVFKNFAKKNKDTEYYDKFVELMDIFDGIHQYLSTDKKLGYGITTDYVKEQIDYNKKVIEYYIKDKNVLPYEQFKTKDFEYKHNSRRARNNRILEIFQTILNHESTLEETLYRSQFEYLTNDRNEIMNKNMTIARKNRSPYNVFDQIKFQEEAMSGAKLKAMSVSLDTFCSVCNTVKPELEDGVLVIYDNNERYDVETLSKSFDIESDIKNGIGIRHKTYGWSKDYRNVAGMFITAYSSQTTAFILDAIKEGSLPNVNEYSFSVFKTLPNLGCDYRAALSFIMSPGVTKIIEANNNNNSVFNTYKENPIQKSIKDIAKQLKINVDKNTPITAILASINAKYGKQFNDIFKTGKDDIKISLNYEDAKDIPIDVRKLIDRIKGIGEFDLSTPLEKKLLFDLGTILTFNRLKNIADQIGDIARCCNPDKFGAKQTVYETRQVFKTIDDILFDIERIPKLNASGKKVIVENRSLKEHNILSVDGKHILEAIYPGCSLSTKEDDYISYILSHNDVKKSYYKTLYSYLKHSTAISTLIAKNVLDTERKEFVNLLEGLKSVFNGFQDLDEETYNTFKKYVLSGFYNNITSIKYNVHTRFIDGKIVLTKEDGIDSEGKRIIDENALIKKEAARIRGYGKSSSLQQTIEETYKDDWGIEHIKVTNLPFIVNDIYNPTDDEMKVFETFSPAQKVKFIQQNFPNSDIFGLLNVSLYNGAERGRWQGMQTIEFKDDNLSSNVLYAEFKQAFYNKNPLIVSAAIDLVKYAVQVEGLNMSAKAINKIIDYDVLIGDFGELGLGFVSELKDMINSLGTTNSDYSDNNKVMNLYENFLRSHPDLKQIRTLYLSRKNVEKYGFTNNQYGCYILEQENTKSTEEENKKAFNTKLTEAGIMYHTTMNDNYYFNEYIRLKSAKDKTTTLYKIVNLGKTVILYPITNLEANENSEWSVNERNNNALSRQAYKEIINSYILDKVDSDFNYDYVKDALAKLKEEKPDVETYYQKRRVVKEVIPADVFDINDAQPATALWNAKKEIEKRFSSTMEGTHYLISSAFDEFIHSKGKEGGSVQKITTQDGRQFLVRIYKSTLNDIKIDDNLEDRLFNIKDDEAVDKILEMKSLGYKRVNNLISVVLQPVPKGTNTEQLANASQGDEISSFPNDDDIMSSTSVDVLAGLHSRVISFMKNRRDDEGDKNAGAILYKLYTKGVFSSDDSIKQGDVPYTTNQIAKYAEDLANVIKNMFDSFTRDPNKDGFYLSMLDPEVIEQIKTNRQLRRKYQLACNLTKTYIDLFSPYNEFKATSDDIGIKNDIDRILKSLDKIQTQIPIKQAMRIYYNDVTKAWSTNPLIKEDMIDVLDGYYSTYGSMWKFNDIMEQGSPLMQISLRDIMTNLQTRRQLGKISRQDFEEGVKKIFEEAAKRGETINMHKIVEHGRLRKSYSPKLREKMDELRQAKETAELEHGIGSIAWLKAKLDYDEFIATHFNQEAKQDYYIKKNALTKKILYDYPSLFSEYQTRFYKIREIYSRKGTNGFTEEDASELDKLRNEMRNLYEPEVYFDNDGTLRKRPDMTTGTYTIDAYDIGKYGIEEEEGTYEVDAKTTLLRSKQAANALNEYIKELRALDDQYYKYDAAFNFEQKLEEVINTLNAYEERDANGIPKHPISELMKIRAYREANEWLSENAYFQFTPGNNPDSQTLYTKLQKAFKVLSLGSNRKLKLVNAISKGNNKGNDGKPIYDYRGIPDARLLNDEDIEKIKQEAEFVYTSMYNDSYSDRSLIRNVKPTNKRYKPSFYEKMKYNETDETAYRDYNNKVRAINRILEKYVNTVDGYVHLENIPDTEEGRKDLQLLGDLYDGLRLIRPSIHEDATNRQQVKDFIENEVVFEDNVEYFLSQLQTIQTTKSKEFQNLARNVLFDKKLAFENGQVVDINFSTYNDKDGNLRYRPNRYLFSTMKPVNEKEYLLDENKDEREKAIKLVNSVYNKTKTIYYDIAKAEAEKAGNGREWFLKNHVYNPNTSQWEPLDCWMTYEVKYEIANRGILVGQWLPKGTQSEKIVRDGKYKFKSEGRIIEVDDPYGDGRNPDYKENKPLYDNYIIGSGYDNEVELNESEKDLRDFYKETLLKHSTVQKAKRHFEDDYLPYMGKNDDSTLKTIGKETLKLFGLTGANDKATTKWRKDIGFQNDSIPDIPMTALLKTKESYDYELKINQLKKDRKTLEDTIYEDNNKKAKELKAIDDQIKDYEQKIQEIHEAHLNEDWTYVIGEFIEQMARFNAVQENKQALYMLLNMLHDYKVFNTAKNSIGNLKQDDDRTSKNEKVYEESVDKNLIEVYENFIRRLVFDQWKEDSGMVNITNALQGFTSANYMMMNIKGGVANVTLGESNILAEAAAGEFLGMDDWAFGTFQWNAGVIGFCRRAYHNMLGEKVGYFNKQDAIVDVFDVVDYDENAGIRNDDDLERYSRKVRDLMFSPQNIGEHYMQNSVLFGMLHGHKLVTMSNGETTYMNKTDFLRYKSGELLRSILTDEQIVEFEKFKKEIKADKNTLRDYAWFRKDSLSQFMAKHLTREQRQEISKVRKQKEKEFLKEFEELENMYDQITVKDGKFAFVEGSTFAKLAEQATFEGSDINKAFDLIGKFTERVRKVNNKIHGVYNKDGRAYIESRWFGSLVMQYHKHLPIGILKHYMRRGHWNEFREAVDKGMLQSVIDMHRLNIAALKAEEGLTDEQIGALEGFIFLMTHCLSYLGNIRLTWNIMPEYDRANIRRRIGNYAGVAAALATTAGLWAIAGGGVDDDTPDNLAFNFFLYEADRLASEAFMYNPLGAASEIEKLFSSPVAAKSIVDDTFKSLKFIIDYIFDEDFDPYYHSGRFAGENKLTVYIKRRIPIYSAIYNTLGLQSANHYYKYGENPIGIFNVKNAILN